MSYDIKQVIVVRKDLNMRKGKIAAQCSHASMKVLLDLCKIYRSNSDIDGHLNEIYLHGTLWCEKFGDIHKGIDHTFLIKWLEGSFAKIVVSCDNEEELKELQEKAIAAGMLNALITDSGATEFHGVPTNTCLAIGPDNSETLNKITRHLKLL